MPGSAVNNKRIAKNTIFLYARMVVSLLVTLYTSRVVLKTLGDDDFGIYGVVGGVVAMFSFLNSAMSGATSRFLTYEMGISGERNTEALRKTFSSAVIVHLLIALVIVVISETFGLWFLHNKLVIPPDRIHAANWVFQCSIIGSVLSIIQVPYNATVVAHEKMDIFAYVELLQVFLKLAIVFLLLIGDADKLILYALLSLLVGIIIILIYRIYCLRHFEESHFIFVWDKNILKPMLSFSGWNLYGNMCTSFRQQANNFLINMFFGVALNAASSITTNVYGAMIGFSSNVILAFRPQIVKSYAQGDINYMQQLMRNSSKYSVLMSGFILIPLLLEIPLVLDIWLDEVPAFTSVFCSIIILGIPLVMISNTLLFAIQATGRVQFTSIFNGTIYLLSIPLAYLILRFGNKEISTYVVSLLATLLILISNIFIFKKLIPAFSIHKYVFNLFPAFFTILIAAIPSYLIYLFMNDSVGRLLLITTVNALIICIISYFFLIDKDLRIKINSKFNIRK